MKEPVSSIQAPSRHTKIDFTRQWQNFVLGFQHLLAMYSGDVLVPLLIGHYLHFSTLQMTYLVSIDIFMCGVATLLQLKRTPLTGIGLPVVLGCAVQAVTPLETIGGKLGITYMYGAIIAAGIFVFLIAGFFARLKKFFPPIVTGSLITIIGFTLVPVGFQDLGGGTPTAASFGDPANLLIGFLTIAIILLFNAFARGFMKSIAILLGILISSFIAGALGFVSLKPVSEAAWFHTPQLFSFNTLYSAYVYLLFNLKFSYIIVNFIIHALKLRLFTAIIAFYLMIFLKLPLFILKICSFWINLLFGSY